MLNPNLNTKLSVLSKSLLTLRGKQFSFEGYEPFELIYDVDAPTLTLKAGRQVGKSVSVASKITVESVARPFFISLYLAPLSQQTSRFSTFYLDAYLNAGLIKKYFRGSDTVKNVFEKSLTTGSRIYLGYGSTTADLDRIRGISADSVYLDEAQDLEYDAIPVIYETMSASPFKWKRISGTSKTLNNTLEHYWNRSSQCEWGVKCTHCGKWNIPDTVESCMAMSENRAGIQCRFCTKLLDVSKGQWIVGRPDIKDHPGFHLPQIAFSSRTTPKEWPVLYAKIHNTDGQYSLTTIYNEVFGIATDTSVRPISRSDILKCCNPSKTSWDPSWPADTRSINRVIIGVDWSTTAGVKSFTVITVVGFDYRGKAHILFAERLQGTDILAQVERVRVLFHQYSASLIASDRGVGVLQAQLLQRDFGAEKCAMIAYTSAKIRIRWDPIGLFWSINRTQAVDKTVYTIKQGKAGLESPCWELTAHLWDDALNIFDHETASGTRVYRKDPEKTDDFLHSLTFALIGDEILERIHTGEAFDETGGQGEDGYGSITYDQTM